MNDIHNVIEPATTLDLFERIIMCPEELLDNYLAAAIKKGYPEDELVTIVKERENWASRMKK